MFVWWSLTSIGVVVVALLNLRKERIKECYQRLESKTDGARVGQLSEPCIYFSHRFAAAAPFIIPLPHIAAKDDWSNIDAYAAQLGWYNLFLTKKDKEKHLALGMFVFNLAVCWDCGI